VLLYISVTVESYIQNVDNIKTFEIVSVALEIFFGAVIIGSYILLEKDVIAFLFDEIGKKIDMENNLKIIINNLEESIIICSNNQIVYANDVFIYKF
jgi:hypothetical protein